MKKKRRVNLSSLFWENSNEKGNQMEKKKKGGISCLTFSAIFFSIFPLYDEKEGGKKRGHIFLSFIGKKKKYFFNKN